MLYITSTPKNSELSISGFIKMLVMATYASMLLAAGTGTAMVLVRPPDGEAIDNVLGAVVSAPGLALAVLGSISFAFLFRQYKASKAPKFGKI
jgi:hypothetical protein